MEQNVATKSDLKELRIEVLSEMKELRNDLISKRERDINIGSKINYEFQLLELRLTLKLGAIGLVGLTIVEFLARR